MSDVRTARIARMMDDPDMFGDLLLVGVAFARYLDFGGLPPGERLSTKHIALCVWPHLQYRERMIKRVLAQDARTYQAPPMGRDCGAPMIRRDGPCGQRYKRGRLVTDWETGERVPLVACSRHLGWFDEQARINRESQPETVPLPAANHGGVLARHIPEFGWPKVWRWATDGRWVQHPEVTPWKPPTLTLHLGDGDDIGSSQRPTLVPVEAS